jgi:hypothetical protein
LRRRNVELSSKLDRSLFKYLTYIQNLLPIAFIKKKIFLLLMLTLLPYLPKYQQEKITA